MFNQNVILVKNRGDSSSLEKYQLAQALRSHFFQLNQDLKLADDLPYFIVFGYRIKSIMDACDVNNPSIKQR